MKWYHRGASWEPCRRYQEISQVHPQCTHIHCLQRHYPVMIMMFMKMIVIIFISIAHISIICTPLFSDYFHDIAIQTSWKYQKLGIKDPWQYDTLSTANLHDFCKVVYGGLQVFCRWCGWEGGVLFSGSGLKKVRTAMSLKLKSLCATPLEVS